MINNETIILLLFIIISILNGISIGLLDSRNYWRKKWEEDEDYIIENIRGKKNDK